MAAECLLGGGERAGAGVRAHAHAEDAGALDLGNLDACDLAGQRDAGLERLGFLLAAERAGLLLDFRQTNDEGQLIDWVQEARTAADGLLIDATSLSYTSIAVMDAMLMLDCPVIELHMFNIHRREPFRHKTFTSLAATASLCGLGPLGYELAIGAMADLIAAGRRR